MNHEEKLKEAVEAILNANESTVQNLEDDRLKKAVNYIRENIGEVYSEKQRTHKCVECGQLFCREEVKAKKRIMPPPDHAQQERHIRCGCGGRIARR